MENAQNLIKKLLSKKSTNKAKEKLKNSLKASEYALNDLAQGGNGEVFALVWILTCTILYLKSAILRLNASILLLKVVKIH